MGKKTFVWLVAALLIGMIIIGGCTSMQTAKVPDTPKYPDRPITVIVPFSAGGASDIVARALEKNAIKYIGQPLAVVNKPGGGGAVGWNELAASNPDGYTIGITGVEIILHPLYGPTKYNYLTALEPIAQVSNASWVMVVRADQPWLEVEDLVQYVKDNPAQIKFGHGGVGSITHVIGEKFAQAAGIGIEPVPFRGGAEALVALLGGHVQVMFASPAVVKEHIKSGTIRALAVAGEKRVNDLAFKNVPTFKEKGLDVSYDIWLGIASPKELPQEVRNTLAKGFASIISDPEFIKNMESIGMPVEYLNPKDSVSQWQKDNIKLSETVKETGILDVIRAQKQ